MRGRKLSVCQRDRQCYAFIKKESPNEGTETRISGLYLSPVLDNIKKESPNEGTETIEIINAIIEIHNIKKESPNEGTETLQIMRICISAKSMIKKESPNEGTETGHLTIHNHFLAPYKKRIPE